MNDPSLAVRSCAASVLHAVLKRDAKLAFDLSSALFSADDRLLATSYSYDLIRHGLHAHWKHFAPTIERMMKSSHVPGAGLWGHLGVPCSSWT